MDSVIWQRDGSHEEDMLEMKNIVTEIKNAFDRQVHSELIEK